MAKRLLLGRDYPTNYPSDAVRILEAMSFGKGLMILGSMSIRSQLYAGDYDGYEVVKCAQSSKAACLTALRKRFQQMVREVKAIPNTFIGDIKAGVVEDWKLVPDERKDYKAPAARRMLVALHRAGIVSAAEMKEAGALLKANPTQTQWAAMKGGIKFHIVRWSPAEVAANRKVLRDGRTMTLEEAFQTPGLVKMDVIGLVGGNRFTDFSVIYEFRWKGTPLNPVKVEIEKSLKENIAALLEEGNYFKALKRQFALAKYNNDLEEIARLHPILNGDLGRLYHITGDIDTLTRLLEEESPRVDLVRQQIDQFTERLAHIYSLKSYLGKEPEILKAIHRLLTLPKERMVEPLKALGNILDHILQTAARKEVR